MLFPVTNIRFTPTFAPTIAALFTLSVTLYLGYWQQGRALEKSVLQAEFDARGGAPRVALDSNMEMANPLQYRYTRASARGEFLVDGQFFLDNKFDHDRVGFHVITPLKIDGTNRYLLVNRGWVSRGSGYPVPPEVPAPSGLIKVEGVLTLPSARFLELSPATIQGAVWQNLTIDRYRRVSGRDTLPLVLFSTDGDGGLKPVLERPDARAEKHVEYMLTWYSLAATIVIFWLALNLKFERTAPQVTAASKEN